MPGKMSSRLSSFRDEHLMVAILAADPGKAKVEIAAAEKFADQFAHDRAP